MKLFIRSFLKGVLIVALCALTVGCSDYVMIRKEKLEEIIDTRLKLQDESLRKELAKDAAKERKRMRDEIMNELSGQLAEPSEDEPFAGDEKDFDLRKICWGMPMEQVIQAEGTNYLKCNASAAGGITYLTTVVDIPCLLHYNFVDARLAGAVCLFADPRYARMLPNSSRNTQKVFNNYVCLKQMLETKYGKCRIREKQYTKLDELQRKYDELEDKMKSYQRHLKDLKKELGRKEKELRKYYEEQFGVQREDYSKKRSRFIENETKGIHNEIRRTEDWIGVVKREKEDVGGDIKKEKERTRKGHVPSSVWCCWEPNNSHEIVLYYSDRGRGPALRLAYNGLTDPALDHLPRDL